MNRLTSQKNSDAFDALITRTIPSHFVARVVRPLWIDGLGATAGLPSSAGNTGGQATPGTPQRNIDATLIAAFASELTKILLDDFSEMGGQIFADLLQRFLALLGR